MCYGTVFYFYFILFYFLYLRVISKYKPQGVYIQRGGVMEGFFVKVWGAYIWRVLYMEGSFWEFYGN